MIVVDASALVDVLIGAGRATERLAGEDLAAPHLLDLEVASVVRRNVRAEAITAAAGSRALEDLADLEVLRFEHVGLLPRIWELRGNVTPYDAVYVALAEVLDAHLVTLDARLAGAPGVRAVVEVLPT